MKKDTRK